MKDKDIITGNRLIAEFMHESQPVTKIPDRVLLAGRVADRYCLPSAPYDKDYDDYWWDLSDVSYHTSWDWLMPVVEKIEGIKGMSVKIEQSFCTIALFEHDFQSIPKNICHTSNFNNKISGVWAAVVKFIEWYNSSVSSSGDVKGEKGPTQK